MSYDLANDYPLHVTMTYTYANGANRMEHVVGTQEQIVERVTALTENMLKQAAGTTMTIAPIHPANVVTL